MQAAGEWQRESGEAPRIMWIPVEVEIEVVGPPAEVTVKACDARFSSHDQDG